MIGVCTETREWGKDDAVLQVHVAYADGGEECRARRHGGLLRTRYEMLGNLWCWLERRPFHIVCFIAFVKQAELAGICQVG
jgi:hypothetical protein